jgi:hypothetical protein
MTAREVNRIHWIYDHYYHLVIRTETETNKRQKKNVKLIERKV